MSIAGSRAIHGFDFQIKYSLKLLLDLIQEKIQTLTLEGRVEKVGLNGFESMAVDDIIVQEKTGVVSYYNVKTKNAHGKWDTTALDPVLKSFISQYGQNPNCRLIFVSDHPSSIFQIIFPEIHASETEQELEARLGQRQPKEKTDLKEYKKLLNIGEFGTLKELSMVITPPVVMDEDTLNEQIKTVGEFVLNKPKEALLYLEEYLRKKLRFGESITRDEVLEYLEENGCSLREKQSIEKIHSEFSHTSSYLRVTRDRFISDNFIQNPGLSQIYTNLNANTEKNIIVVTGKAGVGKTATLAELLFKLESEGQFVLALKSDQVNSNTLDGLAAEIGVKNLISSLHTLEEEGTKVTIIIDQLDALSLNLSSDRKALDTYIELIYKLRFFPNIKVVVSLREYDLDNDPLLKTLTSYPKVVLKNLDEETVRDTLTKKGINSKDYGAKILELLQVPQHLAVFLKLDHKHNDHAGIESLTALYDELWKQEVTVEGEQELLYQLASSMDEQQKISLNLRGLNIKKDILDGLCSKNLVTIQGNKLGFFHQSFFDYVFARRFVSQGETLPAYIKRSNQGLFLRSQIKQILAFLRDDEESVYEEALTLVDDTSIRFHLRLLIVDFIGNQEELLETEKDLASAILRDNEHDLHNAFLEVLASIDWVDFLEAEGLLSPESMKEKDYREKIGWLLYKVADKAPSRILDLIDKERFEEDWLNRKLQVISQINDYDEAIVAVIHLLEDEITSNIEQFDYLWGDILKKLSTQYPQAALKFFFNQKKKKASGKKNRMKHWDKEIIDSLWNQMPNETFEQAIFYLEQYTLLKDNKQPSWKRNQFLIDDRLFHDNYGDDIKEFYNWTLEKAKLVVKENPQMLVPNITTFLHSRRETLLKFSLLVIQENPQEFEQIFYEFTIMKEVLAALDSAYDYVSWLFQKTLAKMWCYWSTEKIENVTSRLLTHWPRWELEHTREHKYSTSIGLSQYHYLFHFEVSGLQKSPLLKKRFQELQRKFPNYEVEEPDDWDNLRMASFVGPPYSKNSYEHMGTDDWMNTFKKINHNDVFREREIRGGITEHARAFAKEIAARSDFFYEFILTLTEDDVDANYIAHALDGLIQGSINPIKLKPLILKHYKSNDDWLRRQVIYSVDYMVDKKVMDDDVFECYQHLALHDPCPKEEKEKDHKSHQDLLTEGINTNRGALAYRVTRLLDVYDRKKVLNIIQKLTEDIAPVRAALLRNFGAVYYVDKALFKKLLLTSLTMPNGEGLLDVSIQNLAVVCEENDFNKLVPVFEKALKNINDPDRKSSLGVGLMFFASKGFSEAEKLLEKNIEEKIGIAQGAVTQAIYEVGAFNAERAFKSKQILLRFKDTNEKILADDYFRNITEWDRKKIREEFELIEVLSGSKAAVADEFGFIEFLKKLLTGRLLTPDQCMLLVSQFLDAFNKTEHGKYHYGFHNIVDLYFEIYQKLHKPELQSMALDVFDKMMQLDELRRNIRGKMMQME